MQLNWEKRAMKTNAYLTCGFAVVACLFAQIVTGQTAMGPLLPEGVALADASAPQPVRVVVGRNDVPPYQVAPPTHFAKQPKTAAFTIQYLNAGEVNYYNDVCIGWPEEAKAAFTYAANIWGTLINSSVPIKISACWANMGTGGILGHGGARTYYRDFKGAPQAGTFYPVAIANTLYGSDLNGGTEEIVIAYNAQFTDWYFGTGTCPDDKIDFVEVILHEMCHGLGFIGSMESANGFSATWGISGYPVIYDRYTENAAAAKIIAYPSGSAALYNQLVSGNVYFNGVNANAGNGGARVKLYAPNTWAQGSSYSHLDNIFNGTPNAMMTYAVDYGETIHNPGAITMGILKDNGWNSTIGPLVRANGATNTITVNYPATVAITAEMNTGGYEANVDWWMVASVSDNWYYFGSQWTSFNGNPADCRPAYQGALFNFSPLTVFNSALPRGTHYFIFAVDYPMDGILNLSGTVLMNTVTVVVQ